MNKRLKKILPFIAATSALAVLVCGLVSTAARAPLLVESDDARQAASTILDRLQAVEPASLEDAALRQALTAAGEEPGVAYTWLFAPDGRVLQGNLAAGPGNTAAGMATEETKRLLAALAPGAVDEEQRLLLLAASAMQAEGEHTDVFRHQVRELTAADGSLTGLVGLTYDANPGTGAPPAAFIASVLAGLAALGLYWLSLPLWVWLDARQRGERAWAWAAFVLLGNLVALLAYILARVPQSTVSSSPATRQRSRETEPWTELAGNEGQEMVRIVTRFNDALNAHDVEAMMALMTPDCVFENTFPPPDGTRYEGSAAVWAFWEEFLRESPRARFEIEEAVALGSQCMMRWTYHWLDASDNAGHVRGVDLFRLEDGLIAEKLSYVKG